MDERNEVGGGRDPGAIRVVLADDHAMVRQALAKVLADIPGLVVVGQAGDGAAAVALVDSAKPDVLVLDYSMPVLDGPSVVDALRPRHPDLKILILTVHESIHYAVRILESGAHGYVVKAAAAEELVEAIRSVRNGEVYISQSVSRKVLHQLRRPRAARSGLESLSQREFDMLRILGAGMGLKECAQTLNISTSTASTYRSRLMEKLHLDSTAAIIRFALENEIVG